LIKKLLKKLLVKIPEHRFLFERLKTTPQCIAVTFDDGPEPEWTYQILESLHRYSAKATFFLLGSKAERYPQCVSDIVREGHEIAIHSYAHQSYAKMSLGEIRNDVGRCESIHSRFVSNGAAPLIRPPYGEINLNLLLFTLLYRKRLALWTIDSNDSFLTESDDITRYVCSQDILPGDVLLFHDDYERTSIALPEILQSLSQRQYTCLTLSKMISASVGSEC